MVTKAHILAEIARTAEGNGGVPLGWRRFATDTGIKELDWKGKHWARWNDAIREAGLTPNTLTTGYGEERLLEHLATLVRELGRIPARYDIELKSHRDRGFPNHTTFERLGSKGDLLAKLMKFCDSRPDYEDVRHVCAAAPPAVKSVETTDDLDAPEIVGYVYLLRSGRYYKIGCTNAVGRRERELQILLPERAAVVHSIKTDDPAGIEKYWHGRFAALHKNGEWYELTSKEIAVFKRRKFM